MVPRSPPVFKEEGVGFVIDSLAVDPEESPGGTFAPETSAFEDSPGSGIRRSGNRLQPFQGNAGRIEGQRNERSERRTRDSTTASALPHGVPDGADSVLAAGDIERDPADGLVLGQYHPLHLRVQGSIEREAGPLP